MTMIANPNFVSAMEATTNLQKGLDKLFSDEVGEAFNDSNLMTLLGPYHSTIRPYVYCRDNKILLNDGYVERILKEDSTLTSFRLLASTLTTSTGERQNRVYTIYRQNFKNYFEILDISLTLTKGDSPTSLFKIQVFDFYELKVANGYIYLHMGEILVYDATTFQLVETLQFDGESVIDIAVEEGSDYLAVRLMSNIIYVLKNFRVISTLDSNGGYITSILINKDKLYIGTAKDIIVHDLATDIRLRIIHNDLIKSRMILYQNFLIYTNFFTFLGVIDLNTNEITKLKLDSPYFNNGTIKIIGDDLYLSYTHESEPVIDLYDLSTLSKLRLVKRTFMNKSAKDLRQVSLIE
jgi:hypothetical protein